ncbi:hypothetical protein [Nitrosovibrio sp. Nv4]|uniref:hypothetical protein n=1 Tax=Nitrosovibrio sp. Nv4 TaxID=1945880 RepID=UPI000BCE084E|nr:hypothetical protein [Nitrosovibrio sp. Nv4]SOD40658.1 hypothetical protein SAMN06298226_0933 [Nitrosovibrio sp. Nv4]
MKISQQGAREAEFHSPAMTGFLPSGVCGLPLIVSYVSIMKSGIVRSLILACAIFFGTSVAPPAQADATGKNTGSMPACPDSTAEAQPLQGSDTTGQKATASEDDSPSPNKGAPDQTGSSSADREPGSCGQSMPDQGGFFRKIIRMLSAPDSCGPNRDVDTNISAGGAGGG